MMVKLICDRYPQHTFYLEIDSKYVGSFDKISNLRLLKKNIANKVINKLTRKILGYSFSTLWGSIVCDLYIMISGSAFIEDKNMQNKINNNKMIIKKFKHKFIIGANFGPYSDESFAKAFEEIFTNYDDVCFRDKYSQQCFKECKTIRYAPDVIFNYSMPIEKKEKRIVIAPIYLDDRENIRCWANSYRDVLVKFCEEAIMQNYYIDLVSFCSYQHDDIAIDMIKDKIDSKFQNKVMTTYYRGNIDEILVIFARAAGVVATRFHSMILGWLAKAYVYPILYSDKMDNILKDMKYDGKKCIISECNRINLQDLFYGENLIKVDSFIENAKTQFRVLDKLMNGKENES